MTQPVTVVVREGFGYLSDVPDEALESLKLATSFRPAGYQYTTLFKKGRSDGRIKLLKHSRFPAGLLARVTAVLDRKGVAYRVDAETPVDDKPDLLLDTTGLQERWYQDEAVEAALLNPRGVVRAPTGAGKTAVIARVVAGRQKWALIVEPTIDLVYQTKAFLEEHLVDNTDHGDPTGGDGWGRCRIGQLGDGVVDPAPVTVATVRTAANALGIAFESYEFGEYDDKDNTKVDVAALRDYFKKVGTLIVDEAHILGASTVFDLATKVPAPNKYGFSASPWRDDGADLMIEAATGPVIYTIKTKELVDGGYLVPPLIQVVDTASWWDPASWGQICARCGAQRGWEPREGGGVRKQQRCANDGGERWTSEFQQAYKAEIVENAVRNMRVADIAMGKDPLVGPLDGATLLLVKQVKHGRSLEQLIPGSVFLSGRDDSGDRRRAFNAVRAGLTDTLIATTIADLGLDLPTLRNLVLAAGGKSTTRHLQRIGRVVRPYEGKSFARVIDLDDGHVHKWFAEQEKARRKIEHAEWDGSAIWL